MKNKSFTSHETLIKSTFSARMLKFKSTGKSMHIELSRYTKSSLDISVNPLERTGKEITEESTSTPSYLCPNPQLNAN